MKYAVLCLNRCDNPIVNCHRLLDLTGPMQLGGLPWAPSTGQVTQQDFVGCISDVYIDNRLLDLNSSVVSVQTSVGCPQKKTHCQSSPCTLGGQSVCVCVRERERERERECVCVCVCVCASECMCLCV